CTGFGICSITTSIDLASNMVEASVTPAGGVLVVDMLEPMNEHGDALVIDEDIVLDDAASRALGSRRATVPHGTYPVDYSRNPNGTVHLPVQMFGFTVEVIVGRPANNCTGL